MARKPLPFQIFREEVTDLSSGNRNHTRQTFSEKQYREWLSTPPLPGFEYKYLVGYISWNVASGTDLRDR